jgi:hypothetical protein
MSRRISTRPVRTTVVVPTASDLPGHDARKGDALRRLAGLLLTLGDAVGAADSRSVSRSVSHMEQRGALKTAPAGGLRIHRPARLPVGDRRYPTPGVSVSQSV